MNNLEKFLREHPRLVGALLTPTRKDAEDLARALSKDAIIVLTSNLDPADVARYNRKLGTLDALKQIIALGETIQLQEKVNE